MKATKAYIASLGTTGVLLGASLLMLAVVSAVVAFDRWPDGTVSTRVQTLVLDDRAAPIQVSASSLSQAASRAGGPSAASRAGALGGQLRGGPGNRLTGVGRGGVLGGLPVAGSPLPSALPSLGPPQIIDVPNPSPSSVRHDVASRTQSATDGLGSSAGRVSPPAGDAITAGGKSAADAVRGLPLPDSLLP
jgi:hypothetical protein